MASREGTPFLPELDDFTLPPPEALAPALARYRAHFAAKRKLREQHEHPASPDIKTVFVRQLKKKDYILIRGQSCQILDIHEHGAPHPHRDQMHIQGQWTYSKQKMDAVLYRDHSIGMRSRLIPEGTVLQASAGILEKGDYTFISTHPCLITSITKPTLRMHSNSPTHIAGISLITGHHHCTALPARTLLRMSDAPVGPFIPLQLTKSPAQTSIVAAAVRKGYYICLVGDACRVESVVKNDRVINGEGRWQVLIVGRTAEEERVKGWFEMGEMVQVGRLGVDIGAWELC